MIAVRQPLTPDRERGRDPHRGERSLDCPEVDCRFADVVQQCCFDHLGIIRDARGYVDSMTLILESLCVEQPLKIRVDGFVDEYLFIGAERSRCQESEEPSDEVEHRTIATRRSCSRHTGRMWGGIPSWRPRCPCRIRCRHQRCRRRSWTMPCPPHRDVS